MKKLKDNKRYEKISLEEEEVNPFCLSFGTIPEQFIKREKSADQVMVDFVRNNNKAHTYIFSGVRGAGKTVMLNYLRKEFDKMEDWIVLLINPEMDILEGISSKLYDAGKMKKYFLKTTFNFSFKGIGFSIEGKEVVPNVEVLLEKMLQIVKDQNKKLLICIDEITSSQNVKTFTHTFKNLVNLGYPIYLLATSINEYLYKMKNEQTLTFLYRSPKIEIGPLNLFAIAYTYKKMFDLDEDTSIKFAKLTEGYASAFQIIGSILFETNKKDIDQELLFEYDKILADINYEKLWSDLSRGDRKFICAMQNQSNNKASDIISIGHISQNSYSQYRNRLLLLGVIKTDVYGYLSFALPRLYNFIQKKIKMESISL